MPTAMLRKLPSLITSEFIKYKWTPAWLLTLGFGIMIACFVYIGHHTDGNALGEINQNPWGRYFSAAHKIWTALFLGPIFILLTSAFFFVEHKADAWKIMYTHPVRRADYFLLKVFTLFIFILIGISILIVAMIVSGHILNFIRPEYEFSYYSIPWKETLSILAHGLISGLGVIGVHIFLSMRFKNFMLPIIIGIIGFVLGIILVAMDFSLNTYFPYSIPLIAQDLEMFITDHRTFPGDGWLSNFEISSIVWFVIMISLATILETRRPIH